MEDNEKIVINEEQEALPEKEPVIVLDYDVKNEEEDRAFLTFQKKYVYPHNIKVTVAFGIVAVVFIASIIRNPDGYLNYVLAFICLFTIALTWYNTVRIRKYLIKALKVLEDDKYRFTLYDDSFVIETLETSADEDEDAPPIEPNKVLFEETQVSVIENDEMFVIVVKKESIYVLAKRLITDSQQEILRDNLSKILSENYFVQQ
ncbi:MAG: hypothetical protein IJ571_01915 [Ruminococcus sp.]|nr:hypothetical protein [Ruminococcus sp.]